MNSFNSCMVCGENESKLTALVSPSKSKPSNRICDKCIKNAVREMYHAKAERLVQSLSIPRPTNIFNS